MGNKSITWVSLWLKPWIKKVWDASFESEEVVWQKEKVTVYDIGNGPMAHMVDNGLCRQMKIGAAEFLSPKPEMVKVGVKVAAKKVQYYGVNLERRTQQEINRYCESIIRTKLHTMAIMAYIGKGTPFQDTYNRFLDRYELYDNELSLETLRKERLRKYGNVLNKSLFDNVCIIKLE